MAGIKLVRLEVSGAHPHSSYTEFLRELTAKLLSTKELLGTVEVVHDVEETRAAAIKM